MTTAIKPPLILQKYCQDSPKAYRILLSHSRLVCRKALQIARRLQRKGLRIDLGFIAEAAMLHDIGIVMTDTPELGCHGNGPYIQHGIRGREILDSEGLPRHARVCERHVGVGLSVDAIVSQGLPLPARDMRPETLEEEIICYADLFYSKGKKNRDHKKSPDEVRRKLLKYGKDNALIFDHWRKRFETDPGEHG